MSVVRRLKEYLDKNNIKYIEISHSPSYTAQEIAESVNVPGDELAKTIIVRADGSYSVVVLPASHRINFDFLKLKMGAKEVRLADEAEIEGIFPDCEVGAMPPFGNLYGLPVYVSSVFLSRDEITFNAGTHSDVIRMKYEDFERIVNPVIESFSEPID